MIKINKYLFICCLLVSCTTMTPEVNFKSYPVKAKLDLNTALVLNPSFKSYSHSTTIITTCENGGKLYRNGKMSAKILVGPLNEEFFLKGLSQLFNKIDVYDSEIKISNKNDYDYILIPDIAIDTSYDKNKVNSRKIPSDIGKLRSYMKYADSSDSYFPISAAVDYKLHIKDAQKDNKLLFIISGHGSMTGSSQAVYCDVSDNLTSYKLAEDYKQVIGKALKSAFIDIIRDSEKNLAPLSLAKTENLALPSALTVTAMFSDTSAFFPNNMLDAGEDAELIVEVKNNGKGTGYGTVLEVSADNPKIAYDPTIQVGDIAPGEAKKIGVPLKTALDIGDGKAAFQFRLREKRGYDSKNVALIVSTARLVRPKLAITSYEINDGRTGLANGNGNGIPENGETVELTAFINNTGAGAAKGVKLILQDINPGIEIEQREVAIGAIAPNQTAKGKVVFTIPRTYAGKGITCKLAVSDQRLGQDAAREIALGFEQKRPILAYTSRILSRGTETTSSANGETIELEITPRNDGAIPARNLQITIAALAISHTPESKSIREILPGSAGTPQRFEIAIPRSYFKAELPVQIALKQADFEGKDDTIAIPVKAKVPKLTYTAVISGKHGGNTVEQSEGASLDVQIQNTGDLEAKDVRVGLNIPNPDIRQKGEKEIIIPVIPAKGFSETIKYEFFVFRKVQAGDLPVQIIVSQADFPTVNFAHKLLVKAESTEVIEIAGSNQKKFPELPSSTRQIGPVMAIARPASGTRVYEQSIDLMGTVADARGIDTIRVEVNGRPARVNVGDTSDLNKKQFSAAFPLVAGENRIRVIARNKDNISTEETTLVYRTEASAGASGNPPLSIFSDIDSQILSTPLSKKPDAKKWAVVIGVEEYRSAPAVPYARRDAQAFKEHLTRRLNVPEENIFILLDKDALLSEFRDILQDRLPARVNSGDTVYFYFAGHGVPDIGNRTPYLLPHDGKPTNPKISALPASELYESLGQLKAENVFVFLDSCFSGAGRSTEEHQMLIADTRIAGFKVNDPVLKQKNIIVMSATEANQVSNAYKDKQHGLFTYFLLKGMVENKGPVKIDDLYGYLKRTVPDLAVKEYGPNRQQTPTLKGLRVSDNPLIMEGAP
jgi:hypothetical protein